MRRDNHSGEAEVKSIDKIQQLLDGIRDDWRAEVSALEAQVSELQDDVAKLEGEAVSFGENADRIHDAICEGRRQDAIDILNDVTGGNYRSVREQANLFPDRVPA